MKKVILFIDEFPWTDVLVLILLSPFIPLIVIMLGIGSGWKKLVEWAKK